MYIKKTKHTKKVIPAITEKTVKVEPDGFPAKRMIVKEETKIVNSYEVWSKQPTYNADALEIAIGTGEPLKKVNSTVLNPDKFDVQEILDETTNENKE